MPAMALLLVLPARVAAPGLLFSDSTTFPVKFVARFPAPSCTVTATAAIARPATAFVGSVEKNSFAAFPGVTTIAPLVPCASAPLVAASVYVPVALSWSPVNDATPAAAVAVVAPVSAPAAGPVATASVTVPVKPVATLPSASFAVTATAKPVRDGVVAGAVDTTSVFAGFGSAVAAKDTVPPPALDVAVAVCGPGVEPSVHVELTMPPASDVTVEGLMLPPPAAANDTLTPPTPTPSLAVTCATTGAPSALPATPVCPVPAM